MPTYELSFWLHVAVDAPDIKTATNAPQVTVKVTRETDPDPDVHLQWENTVRHDDEGRVVEAVGGDRSKSRRSLTTMRRLKA